MDGSRLAESPSTPQSTLKSLHKAIEFIREPPTMTDKIPGYIYATQETKTGLVKIGWSKSLAARRPEALQKCQLDFVQVYYTRTFNWAFKCEKILHKILVDFLHPLHHCPCGVNEHREWYKLEFYEAISAISIVMKWALLKPEPYERRPGVSFSAHLTGEWSGALQVFEDSQITPNRLEWLQFFERKIQSQSAISPLQQPSDLSPPSQCSSLLQSVKYCIPIDLNARHGNLPKGGRRLSTSITRPSRSLLSPSASMASVDYTIKLRQPEGPQTTPTNRHVQRDWAAVAGFLNDNDVTTVPFPTHARTGSNPSADTRFGSSRKSPLDAKTKPTTRLLAAEFRRSQATPSVLDASTSLAQLDIAQTSAESVDVIYTKDKRGVMVSPDGLRVPYAEHESAVATLQQSTAEHVVTTVDVNSSGNNEQDTRLFNDSIAVIRATIYNHHQRETIAKQLEQEKAKRSAPAERGLNRRHLPGEWPEDEYDSADSESVSSSAPISPAKMSASGSGSSATTGKAGAESIMDTSSGKLEKAQSILANLTSIRQESSSSQMSTPALNLAPFPQSVLESLQHLALGPDANWQDTPSRRRAGSSSTSTSELATQSPTTPPNVMNRPVTLDESGLGHKFATLEINHKLRGDEVEHARQEMAPDSSSRTSQESQPKTESTDPSVLAELNLLHNQRPIAVARGMKPKSVAVTSGVQGDKKRDSTEPASGFANAFVIPTDFKFSWPLGRGGIDERAVRTLPITTDASSSGSGRVEPQTSALVDEDVSASRIDLLRPLQTDNRRQSSVPDESSSYF